MNGTLGACHNALHSRLATVWLSPLKVQDKLPKVSEQHPLLLPDCA